MVAASSFDVIGDVNPYIPDLLRPPTTSNQSNHMVKVDCGGSSSNPRSSSTTTSAMSHPADRSVDSSREETEESRLLNTFSRPPVPMCLRCSQPITDAYLFRIRDQTWHEACALCSVCQAKLSDVCFVHEDQLFCRRDYDRLHATRCTHCRQPMRSHELFMRAKLPSSSSSKTEIMAAPPLIFHVSCFTCSVCHQPLAAGDPYIVDEATLRPICRADFLATLSPSTSKPREALPSPPIQRIVREHRGVDDELGPPRLGGGTTTPHSQWFSETTASFSASTMGADVALASGRRMRTSLTEKQRCRLQEAYEVCSRPAKNARERLARELSVPIRVVQVWFQNQRARDKRLSARHHRSEPADQTSHPRPTMSATATSTLHSEIARATSPLEVATPSPRTSVDSGPLPEFGEYISDDLPRQASTSETTKLSDPATPWMPASDAVWLVGSESAAAIR